MAVYFLDTSAIVKRYFPERGSQWIQSLCAPIAHHALYVSTLTLVEVVVSFARMGRENPPRCTMDERDQAIALFHQDVRQGYRLIAANSALLTRVGNLACVHPLRAYDATQLACAPLVNSRETNDGSPPLTFVCADKALLQVAAAEGLSIDNPNEHP